jgi:4-amino-4-deoxy-L-arabinose transferase-like glycosyltransferase
MLTAPPSSPRRWSLRSLALIVLAWLILQVGGLFTPGLLDDVDSVYIEIAREMLHRHDFVTPTIDGIRFFDKPPLMYWMAAGSMRLFGEHDWAARLPLAIAVLALLLAVYALGLRMFAAESPTTAPDRGGLYAALAVATGIGPYLYTRFYIPDILIALWMTLAVHLFLIALDRIGHFPCGCSPGTWVRWAFSPMKKPLHAHFTKPSNRENALGPDRIAQPAGSVGSILPGAPSMTVSSSWVGSRGSLIPCLLFAAVLALNLLTKGLIGVLFPIGFVLLYLALTRQLQLLPKFHPIASTLVFAAIALPWHILAALRNPAIAMPPGLGLPARAGWAWFYLYNEHFARFLGKRIPHDYGQTPVWLFWLYAIIWVMPWAAFLPGAIASLYRQLGHRYAVTVRQRETALTLAIWALLVMLFFSFSSRQEYYCIPALPALFLMAGGMLARADPHPDQSLETVSGAEALEDLRAAHSALTWHRWLLLPLATLAAIIAAWFAITAPRASAGADLATLLANNPELYNLSLGHLFDLTGPAMGLFRGPLVTVACGMCLLGPVAFWLRARRHTYAANLTLAAGMVAVLLAAHEGLVRFNPILGSKSLADAILAAQARQPQPNDLVLIDGELTAGSTLLFYTRQPVHLVDGRVNGPWFGSFWPDAPPIFETGASLRSLWATPRRVFLLTYNPAARTAELAPIAPTHTLASAGGKTILVNR